MSGLSCDCHRLPGASRVIVWVSIPSKHFFINGNRIARSLKGRLVPCVNGNVVVLEGEGAPILATLSLLPNNRANEISPTKDLIAKDPQLGVFVVVNAYPN